MIIKGNTSFSKNSLQKDLGDDTEVHNIGQNNIMFGLKVDYNGVNLLNDKSYFTYSINQVTQVYVQSGSTVTTQRSKSSILTTSCNLNSYNKMTEKNYNRLSINEYL